MTKKITALLAIFLYTFSAYTQTCGMVEVQLPDSVLKLNTPGYGDNNSLLKQLEKHGYDLPTDYFDLIDSRGQYKGKKLKLKDFKRKKDKKDKSSRSVVPTGDDLYIPTIIVLHQDGGINPRGVTLNEIYDGFRRMNLVFSQNDVPIQFFLQNILFVANSQYFDMNNNEYTRQQVDLFHSIHGLFNIHLVNSLSNGGGHALSIPSSTFFIDANLFAFTSSTAAHEAGHCLGLDHTHKGRCIGDNEDCGNCKQESVSRTRTSGCLLNNGKKLCEINGDYLCDTPAEQNLENVAMNINCEITGTLGTDNWGARWTPQEANVMSYASTDRCAGYFTIGQIAKMVSTVENSQLFLYYQGAESELTGTTVVCEGNQTYNYNLSYYTNIIPSDNVTYRLLDLSPHVLATNNTFGVGSIVNASTTGCSLLTLPNNSPQNNARSYLVEASIWDQGMLRMSVYKRLWHEEPRLVSGSISGVSSMTVNTNKYFSTPTFEGYTYRRWRASSGLNILVGQGTSTVKVEAQSVGLNVLEVRAENNCGVTNYSYKYIEVTSASGGGGDPCSLSGVNISVYPNPSKGKQVKYMLIPVDPDPCFSSIDASLDIYSIDGKQFQTLQVTKNEEIVIDNLPSGMYLLKLKDAHSDFEVTNRLLID